MGDSFEPTEQPTNKKAPELSLRGGEFQLIGMRSEVTGDAETALEAAAVALPLPGHERAGAQDRPDKRGGPILVHVLIHQLEVEVQVGDRVPANVRADELGDGVGRKDAGADAGERGRQMPPSMLLQLIPPTEPSRSV